MSEEKKAMNAEELENAAGGYGYQNGFYMTVGDCNGTYLALRSGTSYSPYNEIAQLYPGYSVFTNGTICVLQRRVGLCKRQLPEIKEAALFPSREKQKSAGGRNPVRRCLFLFL